MDMVTASFITLDGRGGGVHIIFNVHRSWNQVSCVLPLVVPGESKPKTCVPSTTSVSTTMPRVPSTSVGTYSQNQSPKASKRNPAVRLVTL